MKNQNFNLDCYLTKGVYTIENEISQNCYIGSTIMTFKRRWNHHRALLRAGTHKNTYLQNAWNKYGEEAFTFKKIEETDEYTSLEREQWYLDNVGRKYNINNIASGTPNMSRETIDKRSKTFKKFLNKALKYYYKVKEGEINIDDIPDEYLNVVESRLAVKVWNKGLTKEDYDYSYLCVPKTMTPKLRAAREKIIKDKRDKAKDIFVYDKNLNFLKRFRCAYDIEVWSLTEDNNFPIKSRFKGERMGRPIKWLSKINIWKACKTGKPYKGLYFTTTKK